MKDIKVAIVGVGYQGARAAVLLRDHGYTLIGASDVGEKVGKSIREVAGDPSLPDFKISGSLEELLDQGEKPDVVLWSAAVPPHVAVDLTCEILARGISVVSITEELFEGQGELAEKADRIAKEHGVSIIPSGLQDVFWVQLPAVVASSVHNITKVSERDVGNASIFSLAIANEEAGIALSDEEYEAWAAPRRKQQPIQGAPLRELARRMGLTPLDFTYEIKPIHADKEVLWQATGMTLKPGSIIGTEYTTTFQTKEGVAFEGTLIYIVDPSLSTAPGACGTSRFRFEGDIDVTVEVPTLPADVIPLAVVRRIANLKDAQPGLVRPSTLPATEYRHPVR